MPQGERGQRSSRLGKDEASDDHTGGGGGWEEDIFICPVTWRLAEPALLFFNLCMSPQALPCLLPAFSARY